jgi:hypothetical protein
MNLNAGTWQSVIRSIGLVVGGGLAYAGLISQTSAADIVQKMVDAAPVVVQAIGLIMPIGLSIWGAFTHTDTAIVQTAGAVPGVKPTEVTSSAAPELQKLAMDPTVPSVVMAAPTYVPPTPSMRR